MCLAKLFYNKGMHGISKFGEWSLEILESINQKKRRVSTDKKSEKKQGFNKQGLTFCYDFVLLFHIAVSLGPEVFFPVFLNLI